MKNTIQSSLKKMRALMHKKRIAAAVALFVMFIVTCIFYGPHYVDDAYITFRYSRNLAEGNGITFNPGEKVQGSSTPLFTLLLGLFGIIGMIPSGSLTIGILSALGTLALLIVASRFRTDEKAGWLAAFVLSTQLVWILLFVSGMETSLYSFVILAGLLITAKEKWNWTGGIVALCCLIRYDGALLGFSIFLIVFWKAGWKKCLIEAFKAFLIYIPWFIFAWIYFGHPFPQSVRAKMLINCLSWSGLLNQYRVFLGLFPFWYLWCPLAVWGSILILKRKDAWSVFPVWFFVYLMVFIIQRRAISFYPWYLVPLFPPLFLMAAFGMSDIFSKIQEKIKIQKLFPALCVFLILIQSVNLVKMHHIFGQNAPHKEWKYIAAAKILSEVVKPGESILVGELGTLGWFLPENIIIDSAGLISPEISEIRRRDRDALIKKGVTLTDFPDGSPEVTRMAIDELKPDYITASGNFLFIEEIRKDSDFLNEYESLYPARFRNFDQWVYKRKNP
jgi:MFS family permease